MGLKRGLCFGPQDLADLSEEEFSSRPVKVGFTAIGDNSSNSSNIISSNTNSHTNRNSSKNRNDCAV